MIPQNIDDPVVLRRTLEEFEEAIFLRGRPVTPVDELGDPELYTLDMETVGIKMNELIRAVNAIVTQLGLETTSPHS